MQDDRTPLRQTFINKAGFASATIEPLPQDASFRRYFRVHAPGETYILMDAPPKKEKIEPFIRVARHLVELGLRAPAIRHHDKVNGFILLEDFGDSTFTRLLQTNHDEDALYCLAVDTLIKLHDHPRAACIDLPAYSNRLLLDEALLLCDWYVPHLKGQSLDAGQRQAYIDAWNGILAGLEPAEPTLVLRDFHVDNLIRLEKNECGLLDFQDAVLGSAAYDLVSLLEDARRDIDVSLQKRLLQRYFDHFTQLDKNRFLTWYTVLGAQRHCKVLGIFARLSLRDRKHHYLDHLPRVHALLCTHLAHPMLVPLNNWLSNNGL